MECGTFDDEPLMPIERAIGLAIFRFRVPFDILLWWPFRFNVATAVRHVKQFGNAAINSPAFSWHATK